MTSELTSLSLSTETYDDVLTRICNSNSVYSSGYVNWAQLDFGPAGFSGFVKMHDLGTADAKTFLYSKCDKFRCTKCQMFFSERRHLDDHAAWSLAFHSHCIKDKYLLNTVVTTYRGIPPEPESKTVKIAENRHTDRVKKEKANGKQAAKLKNDKWSDGACGGPEFEAAMKVKEVSFKPGTLSPAESRRSTAVNRFPDDFSPGPVSLERKGVKYAPVLVPVTTRGSGKASTQATATNDAGRTPPPGPKKFNLVSDDSGASDTSSSASSSILELSRKNSALASTPKRVDTVTTVILASDDDSDDDGHFERPIVKKAAADKEAGNADSQGNSSSAPFVGCRVRTDRDPSPMPRQRTMSASRRLVMLSQDTGLVPLAAIAEERPDVAAMKRQLETKLKIGDLPVGFVGGGGPCTSTQTLGPVGSEFDYSPTCSPINKKLKESSTLSGDDSGGDNSREWSKIVHPPTPPPPSSISPAPTPPSPPTPTAPSPPPAAAGDQAAPPDIHPIYGIDLRQIYDVGFDPDPQQDEEMSSTSSDLMANVEESGSPEYSWAGNDPDCVSVGLEQLESGNIIVAISLKDEELDNDGLADLHPASLRLYGQVGTPVAAEEHHAHDEMNFSTGFTHTGGSWFLAVIEEDRPGEYVCAVTLGGQVIDDGAQTPRVLVAFVLTITKNVQRKTPCISLLRRITGIERLSFDHDLHPGQHAQAYLPDVRNCTVSILELSNKVKNLLIGAIVK